MRKKSRLNILLWFAFLTTLIAGNLLLYAATPSRIKNLLEAKLHDIYSPYRFTFFCHQPFSSEGKLTYNSCKSCPAQSTKIQWMPIVPYPTLAKHLPCYYESICINQKGKRFKGLSCCFQQSPLYQQMYHDLFNYVPELPALRRQRKNYTFDILLPNRPLKKQCHFYVDQKHKKIEVSPQARGFIARTYLYMYDTYHYPLSFEVLEKFRNWNQLHPPTDWEKERNRRIYLLQGRQNHYLPCPF